MADDSPNLVLELLRAIRGDIAEIKADMVEFRERLGHIEGQVAGIYGMCKNMSKDAVGGRHAEGLFKRGVHSGDPGG